MQLGFQDLESLSGGWLFRAAWQGDCWDWFDAVMGGKDDAEVESWAVLLWFLWRERNAQLYNGYKFADDEIVMKVEYFLENYKVHQVEVDREMSAPPIRVWKKPTAGSVSICTNATILPNSGAGLGVVAHGDEGQFLLSTAKRIRGPWDMEMVEALAAELGAQMATMLQAMNPILESDCLTLIQKMQRPENDMLELGIICRNIKRQLKVLGNSTCRYI
ncbi:unnamed protein product [Linum trigynum]|uniref:RNase H type-1 domain-containing protein n=1 Tax=Linum trigynum TaxID=586398 RepID=A0AAV2FG82_9ROSI